MQEITLDIKYRCVCVGALVDHLRQRSDDSFFCGVDVPIRATFFVPCKHTKVIVSECVQVAQMLFSSLWRDDNIRRLYLILEASDSLTHSFYKRLMR